MQKKEQGFTLIELMITIAVLAIIATMAAPSFGDMMLRQNLNKSTQELVSILNQARAKAVLERRSVRVQLNTTPISNTDNQLNWMPAGEAQLKSGSPTFITFQITGLVDATTDTTFEICNKAGGTKSKKVSVSKMGTIQQAVEGTC
jgi:type IV fimbrial biogenesis protein FimT